MAEAQRHQILLLGLDDRILWQLTRTLAHWEDRIGFRCARTLDEARHLCDQEPVDLMVLDGPELAAEATLLFGNHGTTPRMPAAWMVLADSVPPGGILVPGTPPRTVFIEKPFNPKEFPLIVLRALAVEHPDLTEAGIEPSAEPVGMREDEPKEIAALRPPAVFPEERYLDTFPQAETQERREVTEERISLSGDFYEYLARGFECLKNKDRQGALENWRAALDICPEDRRLMANIARLESIDQTG
jgi:hypothetical protein